MDEVEFRRTVNSVPDWSTCSEPFKALHMPTGLMVEVDGLEQATNKDLVRLLVDIGDAVNLVFFRLNCVCN